MDLLIDWYIKNDVSIKLRYDYDTEQTYFRFTSCVFCIFCLDIKKKYGLWEIKNNDRECPLEDFRQ